MDHAGTHHWQFLKLDLQQHIIDPVRKALDYYTEMEKALEREKQNRAQSESVSKGKETAVSAQSTSEVHTDAGGQASKQDAQWTLGDVTFQTCQQSVKSTFALMENILLHKGKSGGRIILE